MHYVYLLENENGDRYIGCTDNLRQRVTDHNNAKNVSTVRDKPSQLRTYLAFSTKLQAFAFERYMKSGSGHAVANKRLWP
jgi:putative endonuclease